MLTSKKVLALTVAVSAGVAANTFVGFNGAPAAAGARALGVVNDQFVAGELAAAVVQGTAIVVAGGAIDAGHDVQVGDAGAAVSATTGVVVAVALTAATQAGDLIEVLLK